MWFVILTFLLMIGVTTLWWSSIGLLRLMSSDRSKARHLAGPSFGPEDVAILIAARNEELVIEATIRSACQLVSPRQVFIVSDASTDRTAEIARSHGARVMELVNNRGKAGAIVAGLRHFDIAARFRVVMLLDADSRPADDYLVTGLPMFQLPDVVAVAGRATTLHDGHQSWRGRILTTYRERTYVAVQTLQKFGQAASRANAVAIVPGFASMYRTEILEHVDIAAPGLAIEDYNMTFEIHAKRLGRVAFDPRAARAYTQDPDSLDEYVKQMSRWSLGFWQTVLRHRLQFQVFWVALVLFSIEVFVSSLLLVLVVPVLVADQVRELLVVFGLTELDRFALPLPSLALLLGVLLPDLVLTFYVTIATRQLHFLAMAPVFPVLRIIDAYVCLRALVRALRRTSNGVWSSPTRRPGSAVVVGSGAGHESDQLGA